MRWLVTGAAGMLGQDVVATLLSAGEVVTAADRPALDITDAASVRAAVHGHDVVVNTAAWTAVDDAEAHEPEAAAANAVGPLLLAVACREAGARLVQVSTDYVFDGWATSPYPETAPTSPASAYGRTKAAGERAVRHELPGGHLVLRTAWLYGAGGRCFPRTIAAAARKQDNLAVVQDQLGQPTWTRDVAALMLRLLRGGVPSGTYHATSSGSATWFDFAREVVRSAGLDPSTVHPTTTDRLPRPAPRPAFSVLGHDAILRQGIAPIGPWKERWELAAEEVLA